MRRQDSIGVEKNSSQPTGRNTTMGSPTLYPMDVAQRSLV
jgi:hypothetical protein